MAGNGKWSELPSEILQVIGLRLLAIGTIVDYVRFGAVCKPWHFVFFEKPKHLPPQIPWNKITYWGTRDYKSFSCFYSLVDDKYYLQEKKVPWPPGVFDSFFKEDSEGWDLKTEGALDSVSKDEECEGSERKSAMDSVSEQESEELVGECTMDSVSEESEESEGKCSMDLVSKEEIGVLEGKIASANPSPVSGDIGDRYYGQIYKAVITSHPTLDNGGDSCVIMAIVSYDQDKRSGQLAYCKPGGSNWTAIQKHECDYESVTYCNGRFYALDTSKKLISFDIGSSEMEEIDVPKSCQRGMLYIIESFGELLLLSTIIAFHFKFAVYKLDQSSKNWSEVKSLGDRTIFFRPENSISVVSSNHPFLRRDCFYAMNYDSHVRCSIFNLSDGSSKFLRVDAEHDLSINNLLWITPSLW
ncbi:hypothetical protein GIB67_007016 [Kingdonia uniflora]|uniref:KIB1-4 beta-propeller domain-containing protein n=1 Tax=Kingdonia uniflora TaxID=39325 RepID=A0A7J7NZI2_9MAGN|nr:hypothetical protein GIB67_007016 [Kingdonia uniflora]